jgi:hypothetical protein
LEGGKERRINVKYVCILLVSCLNDHVKAMNAGKIEIHRKWVERIGGYQKLGTHLVPQERKRVVDLGENI